MANFVPSKKKEGAEINKTHQFIVSIGCINYVVRATGRSGIA